MGKNVNSVTNRIMAGRTRLSASSVKVADWVITNTEMAATLTSQELADRVGVSQSCIVKFTQKIGFKGYGQFKLALSEEIGRKRANQDAPLHSNILSEDSTAIILQKLVKFKTDALFQTTNALSVENFEQAVNLIDQSQRVQIVGLGASALSGKDLGYKLLKLGITAIAESDSHAQIAIARTLTPQDVQIVISFSGNTKESIVAASAAKEKGAQVIALSSPRKSYLRDLADLNLDTIADELQNRASSIAARTAQNVITDALFVALVKKRGGAGQEMIDDIALQMSQIGIKGSL